MNDIIAFFLVIFLFVSGFISVSTRICDNANRRIDKQNINLAGKAVAEYAEYDGEDIIINEKEYILDLCKLTSDTVVGGIFVYSDKLRGIDSNGRCVIQIQIESMSEDRIISLINNIMYELIPRDSSLAAINIACKEDYIKNYLFNSIDGTTVFVITNRERHGRYTYNVAGYKLKPKETSEGQKKDTAQ